MHIMTNRQNINKNAMEERVKEIIARELGVSIDEVQNDLAIGDLPEWDSLHHVAIIFALQKEFGITFSPDDLMDIEDVSDIIALVNEQL